MRTADRWEDIALKIGLVLAMGLTSYGASVESLRPLFVFGALLSGGLVFRLWQVGRLSFWGVLGLAFVLRLLFFSLLPGLSDDAFRYIWDGILQDRGLNPYLYRPDELALQDESLFSTLNSPSYYTVYPPLSQWIFLLGAQAYGGGWEASYYVIKTIFVALEGAGLWLLGRLVEPRNLLLYACHPLVVIAVAGQAHTEAALVFFLVAACWAARMERGATASLALAGATLVKLFPVVLFPFLWQRFGWRGIGPGIGALVFVSLPFAHPEVLSNVASSLQLYVQLFEFNAGLYLGTKELLLLFTGADLSKTLGPLLQLFFLLSLAGVYVIAVRRKWPFWKSALWALGTYILCATTVHPWYLLAVLPLAVFTERPAWHWHALGLASLGTYLLYTHNIYEPFVWIGWGGWLALAAWKHRGAFLEPVLRQRARGKVRQLAPHLPDGSNRLRVLDLGAAEGYVGAHLEREYSVHVTLIDVRDKNKTELPHMCYDGRRLPFPDDRFDVTVLYFVLHHCTEPGRVLREALRVSRQRVLIVESTFRHPLQQWILERIDQLLSILRFGLEERRAPLRYRRPGAWKKLIEDSGGCVLEMKRLHGTLHPQVCFVVEPAAPSQAAVCTEEKASSSASRAASASIHRYSS